MAISEPGIFLENFGVTAIITILASPISNDQRFIVSKCSK